MRAVELTYNPEQRFAERLLLEEFGDFKPRHKRAMVKLIVEQDISPVQAISALSARGVLSGAAASAADGFCDLCRRLSSRDSDVIARVLADRFVGEMPQLSDRVETFLQQLDESDPEGAISDFCDILLPESALPAEDPRSVLCLTMHGSKGLTKKTVVMPGLEDAWLPGNADGDDLEERKRLFYVALTRATDEVLITYPWKRAKGDPLNYDTPGRGGASRFIDQSGIEQKFVK